MSPQPRKVHRTPNVTAFLLTGGLLGLFIGVGVSVFGNPDPRYEATAAMAFLGLICTGLGVLLGGLAAVLLDKRS